MPTIGLGGVELLVTLVLLIGLIGCALPILPGPPLMFLALGLYDLRLWLDGGYSGAQAGLLALAAVLTVVGSLAEWWMSGLMARRAGAQRRTVLLALAGGSLALLLAPFSGGLSLLAALGLPFVLVVLLEHQRDGDRRRSLRAGCGYLTGWALATAVEAASGLSMMVIWLWKLRLLGFW